MDYFRSPDGPMFMIICGEGPCSGIANDYINVRFYKFDYCKKNLKRLMFYKHI